MAKEEDFNADWQDTILDPMTGGINTATKLYNVSPNQLADASNVRADVGLLKVDTGYKTFGGTVRGIPRREYKFHKKSGLEETILITNATVYKYTTSEWQYIQGPARTTTDGTVAAGVAIIPVTATTGFTVGKYIGITLDDGTQHQSTIASISAGVSITIDDAILTGRSVLLGATVLEAVELSGTNAYHVIIDTMPAYDWMIFTNGIDEPQRYDGTDCIDVPGLPSGGAVVCRFVKVYNNFLMLLNTVEGGTAYPQRIRWSDVGEPGTWASGVAGYEDLYNTSDHILSAALLGPYLIVYKESTIIRGQYVGSVFKTFHFETAVPGYGPISNAAVVQHRDFNMFLSRFGIFIYQGGMSVQPISDAIHEKLFDSGGNLSAEYRNLDFGFFDEDRDEIWFMVVTSDDTEPKTLYRFSVADGSWFIREFNDSFMGYGIYEATAAITWNDLIGSWNAQSWTWNSSVLTGLIPAVHLCGNDLQVYDYDHITTDDNGTDIPFSLDLPELFDPKYLNRVDLVEIKGVGSAFLIEYSIDQGVSWSTYGTADCGITLSEDLVHKQIVVERVQFRISGTQSGAYIESVRLRHKLESKH